MPPRHHTFRKRVLLRMRIAKTGEPVYQARARVASLARRLGFSGETLDGIVLAFSEALSNAIQYGSTAVHKWVDVRASLEDEHLVVEVKDHGTGFEPESVELPMEGRMSEGGRGLYLIREFMDDVQWLASTAGTTVRMIKKREKKD